jgi:cell wall-associated NlpC family hydrolase
MSLTLLDPNNLVENSPNLIGNIEATHQCAAPKALIKAEPNTGSQSVSELLFGELVAIIETNHDWFKIACERDGYVGWVKGNALRDYRSSISTTHYVIAPISHRYREPSLKSEPLASFFMTSSIEVIGGAENGFLPLKDDGWIYAKHVAVADALTYNPVVVAKKFIGSAYLWGGRSYEGLDCSALVQLSLFMAGTSVMRDSGMQFDSIGRLLDDNEQPICGDLAFFPGHVGWMVDGSNILHANATHMAVTIDPIDDVIRWVASETDKPPFLGYRRIVA